MSSTIETKRRWGAFTACCLVIFVVWGWGLPWLAKLESVKRRNDFLDERGIDPSAMFYTELEMMTPLLKEIESR